MDKHEAQAALAAMDKSREKIASLMEETPMWRHLAFGAVLAVITGTTPLGTALQASGTTLGMLGVILLLNHDRKTYGTWVSGLRPGKTLPLTIALIAGMVAMIIAGIHYRDTQQAGMVALAVTVATLAIGTLASIAWTKIYVRELRKGAA